MPKPVNCCVPGCLNNFRNSSGLQYYRIPKDRFLRKQYVHLIIDGGKKLDRQHLSIFPWTTKTENRRELKRSELPITRECSASIAGVLETAITITSAADEDQILEEIHVDQLCFLDKVSQTEDVYVVDKATQTADTNFEDERERKIQELNSTIEKLTKELKQEKIKHDNAKFDINSFKDSAADISFYTGFHDYKTLMLCYSIVEESAKNINYGTYTKIYDDKLGRPRKLSCFEEFILVLMKLRLGLFNRDLAHRFKVSESSVSLIFRTWIRFLRCEFEALIRLPQRDVLQLHMPPLFKQHYPKTALIIDCTEFEMERPSALNNQSACYSQYKSRTTMKALIGITPSGATAFVSELYPGSTSDKEIVVKSGILNVLQAGDEIMADKGFLIKDELISVGATLVMPNFLKARKQFTKEEAQHNKRVACLRVHVERCMERIKNWHILDRKMPITLAPISSDIIIVLSAFTNFLPPLIS